MGAVADTAEIRLDVTDLPQKNRVGGSRTPARHRIRKAALQTSESRRETGSTPTAIASGLWVFLQTDPLPPRPWDMNPYVYVSSNPINWVDPRGLDIDNRRGRFPVPYKDERSSDVHYVPPGVYYGGQHDGVVEPATGDVYKTFGKYGIEDDVWFDEEGFVHDVNETFGGRVDDAFRRAHPDWENLFRVCE